MRLTVLLCATLTLAAQSPGERAVAAVLDDWHLAAAQADEVRYFSHLAEGAVFLGTDATERWTKPAFQAWAHPIFQRGKAWSFKPTRRAVALSRDGALAWFDEDLATPNLGPSRGSGVLSKQGGLWRIEQYNLSVPIPNALMKAVKAQIEALPKTPAKP
ncbi:MAG: nuclear transport factor 2 family protein [Holophagaceae bacterium]|nr:nuclear transport factor 2 family protein [Holophagaceae bacterium]